MDRGIIQHNEARHFSFFVFMSIVFSKGIKVMFRYEYRTRRFFRKFYDESKEDEVAHNNQPAERCDAVRFGDEIDVKTYPAAGKPVG